MKKSLKIIIALLVSLLLVSSVYASSVESDKAVLSLVKDETCDIQFGTYGEFQKKLVNIDTEKKTIDISLRAKNNDDGNHTTEVPVTTDVAGEVVLAIDVSYSMVVNSIDGITRKQVVSSAANTLVDKLFEANRNIQIGIVKFSTDPNVDYGSDNDAVVLSELSNDKSAVKQSMENMTDMGNLTNIEAGLKKADSLFSSDSSKKKYIVLLTDGLPNTVTSGTWGEYSDATLNPTKAELEAIKNKGINIVSLLIGVTDDYYAHPYPEPQSYSAGQKSYQTIAEEIFGTSTSPKYGSVYYAGNTASATSVTNIITNSIYDDLVPEESTTTVDDSAKYKLTNIVIKDYFPQNIVDNFTFSIVTPPTLGEVSATINTEDNSITWTIPELPATKEDSLVYRLTLKDTINSEILDKDLPTNENVTIDYKEGDIPGDQKHNDKTPVVKLHIPVEGKDDDPTVSPTPIPKTGSYTWALIIVATILGIGASTYGIIKSKKINK